MHHGGDYSSFYAPQSQTPPPNPNPHLNSGEFGPSYPVQQTYASAPPYSTEFPAYSGPASGGLYSQTSEPIHNVPQSQLPPSSPQFGSFPAYSSYPYQQDPPPSPPVYPHQQPSSVPHSYDAPPANTSPSPNPSSVLYPSFSSYNVPCEDRAGRSGQETGNFNDDDSGTGSYDASVTGGYNPGGSSGFGPGFSEGNPYDGMSYNEFGVQTNGLGEGVYRYDGGRSEPYGARGTAPTGSSTLFDDYGRSISLPSGGNDLGGGSKKIVKAVPKVEAQQDVKNGVQKFRVRLLPEGGGQSAMDVLCQIGLDGIRMLDPSTNRLLRVYFLENIIRCEVTDSSTFTFWSKTSVDIDPMRIRLQSNSHTTNILLDAVTAATVQLKEIDGTDGMTRGRGTADANRVADQSAERKKGLVDWMNLIKPSNEEKDHWVPDEAVTKCTSCGSDFGAFNRRHHCRNCGDIFCDKCTKGRIALTADENAQQVRVCDRCMAEASQRLSNTKETASNRTILHTHEHLARKIQEEMDKNRKSGSNSTDDGKRMREVACPICTVHLQVQVPASGSETIECGVCQHPFLVSAH